MIAIAESGSTKTNWTVINKDGAEVSNFSSAGLNPYTQNREQILEIVKEEIYACLKELEIKQICFYGAGCSTDENREIMRSAFRRFFSKTDIHIEHDLLAAARALYHNKSGIAIILGTGANSCVYDGSQIVENVRATGWIMGDEGSGAYMGKMLMRDFMYNRLPRNLSDRLSKDYNLDTTLVLDKIYKKPNPNRWLASMSEFIRDHISEEYCHTLVHKGFYDFFDTQVNQYEKYKDLPLSAVGSIAYIYKDILEEVASGFGFSLGKVVKSPAKELVKYHTKDLNVSQEN